MTKSTRRHALRLSLAIAFGFVLTDPLLAEAELGSSQLPLTAAESAAKFELGSWRATELASITFYTSAPDDVSLRALRNAQAFVELVSALVLRDAHSPGRPAEIFLFGDRAQSSLFGQSPSPGEPIAAGDGYTLGLALESTGFDTLVLYQELVHWLLANDAGGPYPAWFDEGLADMLGPTLIRSNVAAIGAVSLARVETLARFAPLPLAALLSATPEQLPSHQATLRHEADAWAFVHYGLMSHGMGGPRRSQQLMRFVMAVRAGELFGPAFERSFGASPEEIEAEFQRHRSLLIESATHPNAHVMLRPSQPGPSLRSVADAEIARRLAGHALRLGPERAEIAAALYDFVLTSEPQDAAALIGRLRAAAMLEDFERAESLWTQIPGDEREHPAAWEALADLAHARYAALSEQDRLRIGGGWLSRARQGYLRVLGASPDRFSASIALAHTYVLEPDANVGPGIELLERAARASPRSAQLRLQLGQLYLRSGDPARARTELHYLVEAYPDSKQARQAQDLLQRTLDTAPIGQ